MANIKLSAAVTAVLHRSEIKGYLLILPPNLERSLYEDVNKVILQCGGKWKRGLGHVFTGDPAAKIGLVLETGESIDQKKKFQFFATPEIIARDLVRMADVSGKYVLEPSAGDGALVRACLEAGGRVYAVELNAEHAPKLNLLTKGAIISNFLHLPPLADFDRVVMNPPFSRKQDLAHVGHAYRFLKPGGILAAIVQGNRTDMDIQTAIGSPVQIHSEPIDVGEFKESGTNIATKMIRIVK